jgi:hypothetical protein
MNDMISFTKSLQTEVTVGSEYFLLRPKEEISQLSFTLHSSELFKRWNRCGLTADYIAAFFSYSLTKDSQKNSEFFFACSQISLELIQNALRHGRTRDEWIMLNISEHQTGLYLEVENFLIPEQSLTYKTELSKILGSEGYKNEYVKRIKARTESPNKKSEGVGLLNLLQKFPIQIGAVFSESNNEHKVKTQCFFKLPS